MTEQDRAKAVAALKRKFLACDTQADAARVLGVSPKSFRDNTRRKLGVYVSKGGDWGKAKAKAWDTAYVQRIVTRTIPAADSPDES